MAVRSAGQKRRGPPRLVGLEEEVPIEEAVAARLVRTSFVGVLVGNN